MCVIIATEKNHKPSLATLQAAERANPHGGGIAWVKGNRVHWQKGLTSGQMHKIILRERGPFVIHFRIASVGAVIPELCHPFPVGGTASLALAGSAHTVLFQNGTWNEWEHAMLAASDRLGAEIPPGPFSDARAAAWMVAQFGKEAFRIMGGKFLTFDKKGWKIQKGDWHKQPGFVCSNTYWLPATTAPARRYTEQDLLAWERGRNE